MNDSDIADIISINETKLESSINDNEVYMPGYEIVRKYRNRKLTTWAVACEQALFSLFAGYMGRGGGVCIYVRCNLNYKMWEDLSSDELESTSFPGPSC
jgi:hypothetical protein